MFLPKWSEAEATAEKERLFPAVAREDCAITCDDCFQLLKARFPQHFNK